MDNALAVQKVYCREDLNHDVSAISLCEGCTCLSYPFKVLLKGTVLYELRDDVDILLVGQKVKNSHNVWMLMAV